jgi:hypothetical protein
MIRKILTPVENNGRNIGDFFSDFFSIICLCTSDDTQEDANYGDHQQQMYDATSGISKKSNSPNNN